MPPGAKRRSHRVECVDWHIAVDGATLTFTPSGRTILRQLWVTALAAVLIGALAMWFGMPPGSHKVSAAQERVEQTREALDRARTQRDRIGMSTSGKQSPVYHGAARTVDQIESQLAREEQQLTQTRPSLSPIGNGLYWSVIIVLAITGLSMPIIALFTRVRLTYEGPPGKGTLTVLERDLWARRNHFDVSGFLAMGIHIRRVVTHSHEHRQTTDHGWMWTIILVSNPDDITTRDLHVSVEMDDSLPVRPSELTTRVRDVVRYLEAITLLEHEPPVQTDVTDVEVGFWKTKYKMRTTQHGRPAEGSKHS